MVAAFFVPGQQLQPHVTARCRCDNGEKTEDLKWEFSMMILSISCGKQRAMIRMMTRKRTRSSYKGDDDLLLHTS